KREEGLTGAQASSEGAKTVAMAVTASTLTTVAVFLPLIFVEGLAGQLLRDQALTISFSLLASLAVALTIVPTLSALGARRRYAAAAPERETVAEPKKAGMPSRIGLWSLFGALYLPRLLTRGVGWLGHRAAPVVDRALGPFDAGYQALITWYPKRLRRVL